ncbi:MAG: S-layer homology domain-containing protein [Clostridia bacterium]|nr:S-layer homology domain-containing protein [Clostridia bacterium]
MKKIVACICAMVMLVSVTAVFATEEPAAETPPILISAPVEFAPSPWAAEEVIKAEEYGLLAGFENVNYQKNITRAEFAKLIVNCVTPALGLSAEELVGKNPSQFTDVEDVYVDAASLLGIVNGVGEGLFAPDKEITRQEIAVMMYRAINTVTILVEKETGVIPTDDLTGFTDAESVASWAKVGVATLATNGIMKGVSETELSPLTNTSTEQAILLAARIFEVLK